MNLIELKNTFIGDQLQLEEKLLREKSEEYCLINTGSSPAIVMGISGKADMLIHEDQNHLPVLRRFSGGGTVVIDENTIFVTFICNKTSHPFPAYPEPILRWAESQLAPVTPGLTLRENDFVLGEKKCGGNALYIKKDRWLIHTSFLWDYDPEKMALLKYPPKTPTYRQRRSHTEFICRLKDYFPSQESWIEKLRSITSLVTLPVEA
jgi:lipoate-protein ligase A